MEEIKYVLSLTGSSFFDAVVIMRAQELTKKYTGISLLRDGNSLIISGQLSSEQAALLREELDYSEK